MDFLSTSRNTAPKTLENTALIHALKLKYPYQRQINEVKRRFNNDLKQALKALAPYINYQEEWKKLVNSEIKVVSIEERSYPPLLKRIKEPPELLYYRGNLNNNIGIAIVGSRKSTDYGSNVLDYLIEPLKSLPISIISGLAYGIDTLAHKKALDLKLRTIAVLGSGLNDTNIYPSSNLKLAKEIINSGGAIISELPPESAALSKHFPMRNRIVAGLSSAVVVIEANQNSGALITARAALQEGKPVFTVPNDIFENSSSGANQLLKEGALPITEIADLLKKLNLQTKPSKKQRHLTLGSLSDIEMRTLEKISRKSKNINELLMVTKLSPQELNFALITLELKNIIKKLPGDNYTINNSGI